MISNICYDDIVQYLTAVKSANGLQLLSSESSNGRQIVISNGLKEPVTDRFYFRNRRMLTSVTKKTCNGRLRSPLPEVLIGNGRCGGEVGVEPAALMRNGRQTTTVTDGVHVTGVKGPLQMLRDLCEVFT